MPFSDEVKAAMIALGPLGDSDCIWSVEADGPDVAMLGFMNAFNPTRRSILPLQRGCDLSCLPAAVAVQVYAVTA